MILTGFNAPFDALKALVAAPVDEVNPWDERNDLLEDVIQSIKTFIEGDERNYRKSLDDLVGELYDISKQMCADDVQDRPEWSEVVAKIENEIFIQQRRGLKVA